MAVTLSRKQGKNSIDLDSSGTITDKTVMEYSVFITHVYSNAKLTKVIAWLNAEVGAEHDDWTFGLHFASPSDPNVDVRGLGVIDKARFKREEDKVKFILKWL